MLIKSALVAVLVACKTTFGENRELPLSIKEVSIKRCVFFYKRWRSCPVSNSMQRFFANWPDIIYKEQKKSIDKKKPLLLKKRRGLKPLI